MGNGICCIGTCDSPHFKGGWCREHWEYWEVHGFPEPRPNAIRKRHRRPPAELFWGKVNKDGPAPDYRPELGPCWLWTGAIAERTGYGNFGSGHWVAGESKLAHRWSYRQCVGKIPDKYQVDHLCRVRHCVRPDHLEAVTQEENIRRQFEAANITHCPWGHEYTPENTVGLHRECKTCKDARHYIWWLRKKEELVKGRQCVVCGIPLPFELRSDAKYCSDRCRRTVGYALMKAKRHAASAAKKAAKAAAAAGDIAA